MNRRLRGNRGERGYVMLIVIVILLVLLSAGAYSLKAADSEIRSSTRFRRSELLAQAADAGAAQRMSYIAVAAQPTQILNDLQEPTYTQWTPWPSVGLFPGTPASANLAVDSGSLAFRTGPIRLNWTGKTPPPGVQVGTPTYIFEFNSFSTTTFRGQAITAADQNAGEAEVAVSVKTWDAQPQNY
jgi:hypothetical protein